MSATIVAAGFGAGVCVGGTGVGGAEVAVGPTGVELCTAATVGDAVGAGIVVAAAVAAARGSGVAAGVGADADLTHDTSTATTSNQSRGHRALALATRDVDRIVSVKMTTDRGTTVGVDVCMVVLSGLFTLLSILAVRTSHLPLPVGLGPAMAPPTTSVTM